MDLRLWQELVKWAQQDLRSVNGQIEFLLREAVHRRRGPDGEEDEGSKDRGGSRK